MINFNYVLRRRCFSHGARLLFTSAPHLPLHSTSLNSFVAQFRKRHLREFFDDLFDTRVSTHDQAQGPDQHQTHIFRHHNLLFAGSHYFPEGAQLYDRWESQSQARQTKRAEHRYEEIQLWDRDCQTD